MGSLGISKGRAIGDRAIRARVQLAAHVMLALISSVGCIQRDGRPLPLYAGPQRGDDAVALLRGPVSSVDGKKVPSRGSTFALLPGCHVVKIGGLVHHVDPNMGGTVLTLPVLKYAFRMRPGHFYAIDVEMHPALGFGPSGRASIVASERAPDGTVRMVPSVQSQADVTACAEWSREVAPGEIAKAPPTSMPTTLD